MTFKHEKGDINFFGVLFQPTVLDQHDKQYVPWEIAFFWFTHISYYNRNRVLGKDILCDASPRIKKVAFGVGV
jgi:hypothetical protein